MVYACGRLVIGLLLVGSFLSARAQSPAYGQALVESRKEGAAGLGQSSHDVRILFTGRLLGYLGLPDVQSAKPQDRPCPDPKDASPSAGQFLSSIFSKQNDNTIVVGMGDNFAPAISARWLNNAPDPRRPSKDMNTWDWVARKWVPIRDRADWDKNVNAGVRNDILAGRGYIETDNVGCFLAAAGYDAIVPGTHDFHFGAERLRYLARFLAATPSRDVGTTANRSSRKVVNMLAANLAIQTTYAKPHPRLPDGDRHLRFSTSAEYKDLVPENVSDQKFVLPWLQHVYFRSKVSGLGPFYVCEAPPGKPDELSPPCGPAIEPIERPIDPSERQDGNQVRYDVKLASLDFLAAGRSYGICAPIPNAPKGHPGYFCTRLSVYSPFFQYPNPRRTARNGSLGGQAYKDPEPYVLKKLGSGKEVAVFGVVDPGLISSVGQLNAAWENANDQYKTDVVALDPAEALQQQLQYFNREYEEQNGKKEFDGMKVLLAQMSPPLARQLAARLKGVFNVVVSEADTEQATQNGRFAFEPLVEDPNYTATLPAVPRAHATAMEPGGSRQGTVNPTPTFVAVPPPYFDDAIGYPVLQIRQLDITHPEPGIDDKQRGPIGEWVFAVGGTRKVVGLPDPGINPIFPIDKFGNLVADALKAQLEPDAAAKVKTPSPSIYPDLKVLRAQLSQNFKSLTLTTLKRKFDADVAMMQDRDFYFGQPPQSVGPGANPAEVVERILWKDDLAHLAIVKGSTLLKLLKQSELFDNQDKQSLSLEVTKRRALVTLGIFHDALRDEYLVNGEVLDPNRSYSVATTDYIGLGGTGYADITEPGFDNPQLPRQFPRILYGISGLVCEELKKMAGSAPSCDCPAPMDREAYLDTLNDEPSDRGPSLTGWRRFALWTYVPYALGLGTHPPEPRHQMSANPVELSAQDRRLFFISHSSGISLQATDNNLSEAQRKAEFSGIASPSQLQVKESHEVTLTLKDRLGFLGRRVDFYFQPELSYDNVVTGQSVPPALQNFKQNLAAGEIGVFVHMSRDYPRVGLLLSMRDETQLERPMENVALSDTKKSSITFEHARANSLFGHFGVRVQNRHSYFEAGFQTGEVRRVTAFNFAGANGTFSCSFAATRGALDEPACVASNSDDSPGKLPAITGLSTASAVLGSALRYGWFSNSQIVVPFFSRLSYTFTNQFDYLYAGQGSISTDMLYRDLWSNSISLQITRNLSVAPKFDVFFYENQVKHNNFRQVQSSIALKYSFDWLSGNRWRTAIRYTEPK
jgi:hypothetical protein